MHRARRVHGRWGARCVKVTVTSPGAKVIAPAAADFLASSAASSCASLLSASFDLAAASASRRLASACSTDRTCPHHQVAVYQPHANAHDSG
eukprot:COSAG05_NODE_3787_length_1836_cov_2.100173_3_plen_92_part_00